ncbi:DUF2946 domain-containing protein [Duganella sp. FT135W]|uniref:DUF2946 domain-containing protein n=1 Tax=Duganella flavida TaxID=2692175 RepID=A0A6L8K4B8_9BURK|nr:DUF2946 domain-containing protein [Duganella flavida]MYM22343.1 DUF2946 domain-containing protein [Duganella flavida]
MLKHLKRQTLHLWIAIMAVLFAALAPTVSHALAASTTGVLAEMCSVGGPAKKAPTNVMHGMEHCSYCATHGGSPALLPPALNGFAVIGGDDFYPPLFYTAPQPLHTWSAASPRGPPTTS